jgi:outer membrane protein assembly factor BamA
MVRYVLILLCLILQISNGVAQSRADTTKKLSYLIIPIAYRSPETKWAGGIGASLSFKTTNWKDSLTRTSVIQSVCIFTQRHQNIQALDASVYSPKEKYIFLLQLSHSYFPDKFWGIGNNSKDMDNENYSYEQSYFFPHVKFKVAKNLFIGALYELQNVNKVRYTEEGLFSKEIVFGLNPYLASGAGNSISYDTRNSSNWPTKGTLVQTSYSYFNTYLGSKFNTLKYILDVRHFKRIYKQIILANQFYSYNCEGQVPVRELGSIGGANNLRGFYQGRYRDNGFSSFISELRVPVYKQFSLVAFGGVGSVYKEPNEIFNSSYKYSFGGGIRFSILKQERLNMRLDYGFSNSANRGFYLVFGECF